jgi:CheY-like chemotaxis protein
MRAMVIEDDPLISWMLEELLRDRGISSVEIVLSEAQAISAAARACPDLIVAESVLLMGAPLERPR